MKHELSRPIVRETRTPVTQTAAGMRVRPPEPFPICSLAGRLSGAAARLCYRFARLATPSFVWNVVSAKSFIALVVFVRSDQWTDGRFGKP